MSNKSDNLSVARKAIRASVITLKLNDCDIEVLVGRVTTFGEETGGLADFLEHD